MDDTIAKYLTQNFTAMDMFALPPQQTEFLPPLLAPISDLHFSLILSLLVYWSTALLSHWLDVKGHLSQYRIHTPAEDQKRNLVSRWDCLVGILLNQLLQTLWGVVDGWANGTADLLRHEDFEIAAWTSRIRIVQRVIPGFLSILAVDSKALASKVGDSCPNLALLLVETPTQAAQSWEVRMAELMYRYVVPVAQFGVAAFVSDTWLYFGHRFIHSNKFLYKHVHAQHHLLNVPYAYGAAYVHPLEHIFVNSMSVNLGTLAGQLSIRQGMIFFSVSTLKDMYDHCGYSLPWIPIRCDANYHDIHHQSWGIKTNFGMYSSFWDQICGTRWTDAKAAALNYERIMEWAQIQVDKDKAATGENCSDLPDLDIPVKSKHD